MSQHILETDIELGERALYCTVLIEYDYQPGEPMVRYYSDGSGYPGSAAHVSIINTHVTSAKLDGKTLDREALSKIGRGSWLVRIDAAVNGLVHTDCEEYGNFYDEMMSNAVGEECDRD